MKIQDKQNVGILSADVPDRFKSMKRFLPCPGITFDFRG
jgi:hypothetical protein